MTAALLKILHSSIESSKTRDFFHTTKSEASDAYAIRGSYLFNLKQCLENAYRDMKKFNLRKAVDFV